MLINFLAAADGQRLTKTFTPQGVTPYPNVAEFTSISYDVDKLQTFYETLKHHSQLGNCLLKGTLTRELSNERRAGATQSAGATNYIVLDLDFDEGFTDIEEFLDYIGLGGISYILHHSASSGIRARPGLRCHIIMWLDRPVVPMALKLWLEYLNLSVPPLRQLCKLSVTGQSLKWALDVTTCQNDKLIFIADPNCHGVNDPMAGKRFELHLRREHQLSFTAQAYPENRKLQQDLIAELRAATGLPAQNAQYQKAKYLGEPVEYLKDPYPAYVSGEKKERGFVYLNLVGGDSWGYYYPEGRPEYVYNFKGEPIVRLRDIDPDYYWSVVRSDPLAVPDAPEPAPSFITDEDGIRRWYFRDAMADAYYTAESDGTTITTVNCSRNGMMDYARLHTGETPEVIPEWKLEFDPTRTEQIDYDKQWINLYQVTPYRQASYPEDMPCPPTIERLLRSITVEDDMFEHLLTLLAWSFQTGKPCNTGIIFRGTGGTGKGVLFNKILKPIFGWAHCREIGRDALNERFNAFIEGAMWVMLDEGELNDSESSHIINKLKSIITEPYIELRRMRTDGYQVRNWVNIIIATNNRTPLKLDPSDRRWNVAAAQETPLSANGWTNDDVDRIEAELPQFCALLAHRKVDPQVVRTPLANNAKLELAAATETSTEEFFRMFKEGNLDFFVEQLTENPPEVVSPHYRMFKLAVERWCEVYEQGPVNATVAEVCSAYCYVLGHNIKAVRFGRIVSHKWEPSTRLREGATVFRGWAINFKSEDPQCLQQLVRDWKAKRTSEERDKLKSGKPLLHVVT